MQKARYLISAAAIAFLLAVAPVQAGPTTYSGSLTTADGGLIGSGGSWETNPDHDVTFSWTVTQNADLSWRYAYTFNSTGIQGDISHLLIEVSSTFTDDNIFNDTPAADEGEPDDNGESNGNPNIPDTVFSLKFQNAGGSVFTVEFDSDRVPVWGDIFAKGGRQELWNAGFMASDIDPDVAAQNGSIDYHALVPDTMTTTVPVPGAVALVGLGVGGIGFLRRRRAL